MRNAAIKNLNDQKLLAQYASHRDIYVDTRIKAADKLTDKALAQTIYADIVRKARNGRRRLDTRIPKDYRERNDYWARRAAINRITNKEVLSEIINGDEAYVRKFDHGWKITDQDLRNDAKKRLAQLEKRGE